jgi:FAD/FMN-containing dehydrogenase
MQKHDGAISIGQGVGMTKKPYLRAARPAQEKAHMQVMKQRV